MKNLFSLFLFSCFVFSFGCKTEDLRPADAVYIKFVNQTGTNIQGLIVNQTELGDLGKGKTTKEYTGYAELGQQFGYALVDAVGLVNGKRHYASANCQGVCGTPSAPYGVWLEKGYYKIAIRPALPGNYIEFVMQQ